MRLTYELAQVKLPVTDLRRSIEWYGRVFGLRLWTEIVEDGVLRGAGLMDPDGRFSVGLRDRAVCASRPDLRGFDVVAFRPASRAVLDDLAAHCTHLGVEHRGIQDTPGGAVLDIPDPDGTVLRFYHFTAPTEGFMGVEFRDGRVVGTFDAPRSAAGAGTGVR